MINRASPMIPSAAAVALLAVLAPGTVSAQQTMTMKLSANVPSSHYMSVTADQFWMAKVTELTNGRVKFEYYPAQQLGKYEAGMTMAQTGVVDVAQQPVGSAADKLPLSGLTGLPGLAATSCAGTAAYQAVTEPGAIVYEHDFRPNRIRRIMTVLLPQYALITRSRAVDEVKDFTGLKLRTTGGAMDETAVRLGAIPLSMSFGDVYQSLSRGTIDGLFAALISAKPWELHTVIKQAVTGYGFGTAAVNWYMSDAKWQRLPEDIRAALLEAGRLAERNFCERSDQDEASEAAALKAGGVNVTSFNAKTAADLDIAMAAVAEDWAKKVEARGLPGRAALAAFRAAVPK